MRSAAKTNNVSELKDVDIIPELLSFVHILWFFTGLHFTHHYFHKIVEHSFLFHARSVSLSNSLSLHSQLIPLFGIILYFCLNILLITPTFRKPFATSFNIIILFIKPLHFELNQLVLELIEFNLRVHSVDFIPYLVDNILNLLNIIFNFCCNAKEWLFLCLVLILNGFELLKSEFTLL